MMAQFAVLTRIKEPENSSIFSKMRVYDGDNLKDTDPKAKSMQEYRDFAGVDEGMTGLSTRFAYKVLSKVFNFDHTEIAANPVHLLYVLEQQIEREQFPVDVEKRYLSGVKEYLSRAVRRVHRQGDPDRLSRVVLRVRPEHLRPLRHLRRLLDPGPGVPRPEHRRDPRPRGAERRAGEDREAGRHLATRRTSATRSSTSCCARAPRTTARIRRGRATRSCARSSRRRCSRTTEDLLPVISFNAKASEDERRSTRTSSTAWSRRATRRSRCASSCEWYLRVRKSS